MDTISDCILPPSYGKVGGLLCDNYKGCMEQKCFSCIVCNERGPSSNIKQYIDDGLHKTALCPCCKVDAVLAGHHTLATLQRVNEIQHGNIVQNQGKCFAFIKFIDDVKKTCVLLGAHDINGNIIRITNYYKEDVHDCVMKTKKGKNKK
jgi:hypothetical protein